MVSNLVIKSTLAMLVCVALAPLAQAPKKHAIGGDAVRTLK
jgi:hypothetical protein